MFRLLANWILSATLLLVVARVVPGFTVTGFKAALIAAIVIGLINATLGTLLKILTFPLSILTLGIFIFVVNALMLMVASRLLSGFHVSGFGPALWGALLLALLHTFLRWVMPKRGEA
ncbi:MAG TPA: phage holin family protein [Clostridia bacterium]|nr:phage holin family protein [Clostridia bacterium]